MSIAGSTVLVCGLLGGLIALMVMLRRTPFVRRMIISMATIGLVIVIGLIAVMAAPPVRSTAAAAAATAQPTLPPAAPAPSACNLKRPAGHDPYADPVDQHLADGVHAFTLGDLPNIKVSIHHFVEAFDGVTVSDLRRDIARDNLGCALLKLARVRSLPATPAASNDVPVTSSQSAAAPTPAPKTWASDQVPLCVFDVTKLFADSLSAFPANGLNRSAREWLKTQLDPRMNTKNGTCQRVPEMREAIEDYTPVTYTKANAGAAPSNCKVTIYSELSWDPDDHETDRLAWVTLNGETQLLYVDEEEAYDDVTFVVPKAGTYNYHIGLTILYDDVSQKPANHRKADYQVTAACGDEFKVRRCPHNTYQTWLQ